jgi:HPt (histidine-containing phosphotransfer) domain-containing protein
MVREMAQFFLGEVDEVFLQMRAALGQGDLSEVGRLGHRLKGTVVYLGARRADEAALGLERVCRASNGSASEAASALGAFQQECLTLRAALAGHPLAAEPK